MGGAPVDTNHVKLRISPADHDACGSRSRDAADWATGRADGRDEPYPGAPIGHHIFDGRVLRRCERCCSPRGLDKTDATYDLEGHSHSHASDFTLLAVPSARRRQRQVDHGAAKITLV